MLSSGPFSSREARSKFLQRIGTLCPINKSTPLDVPVSERSVSEMRDIPRYFQPLKNHSNSNKVLVEQQSGQNVRVCFQEVVTVVPIPKRSDLTDRAKSKLWLSKLETVENVERNLLEYAAENNDWRNACHEDEMYLCRATGELIHPVHVEIGDYTFSSTGTNAQRSYSL